MKIKGRDLKPIRHTVRVKISVGNDDKTGDVITEEVKIVYRGLTADNTESGANWIDKFADEKFNEIPEEERKLMKPGDIQLRQDQIKRLTNITWLVLECPDFSDDSGERYRLLKDDGMPNGKAFDILSGLEQKDSLAIYQAIMEDLVPNVKEPAQSSTNSAGTT